MNEHFTMTLRDRRVQVSAALTRPAGQIRVSVKLTDDTGAPLNWRLTRVELRRVWRAARGAEAERLDWSSYTCPICKRTSYNPSDVANRYCGACHRFEGRSVSTLGPRGYQHRIARLSADHYRLYWSYDKHYAGSRLRYPREISRDTNRAGAEQFARRWKLTMPRPHAAEHPYAYFRMCTLRR